MEESLGSRYDHKAVEEKIYGIWEKSGYFNPDKCVEGGVTKKDAEVFSILLPPPNVTGELHMGHAAMLVVEDIMVRFARMTGKRTLWVPGTDHAAIATQSKVEKDIMKTEKKSRHDLGREEFLRRVNAFAKTSHDTIIRQIKRLGASLDWSREAYTLDEARERAVRAAFQKLYDLGLIYRGNRVVNWDPKGQTVISDDEVVYEERKAKLYTFRYAKDFPISISTTRPETKVGDTAVAVHPEDARYKKFIGKKFDVEFVGIPLHIKVIADDSVEKNFGTGALGVTPAHSAADWEMAQRHKLPLVQVIDEYARMTLAGLPAEALAKAGPLNGKKTTEAREWIVEELRKQGLLEKEEEITQNVSTAERTGAIIEPLPKLQWFVGVNSKFEIRNSKLKWIKDGQKTTLKELMRHAVESGEIKITPERFEKAYFHWIENLRDWCISRQIWFGHRIPVWYCLACGEPHVNAKIKSKWFLVRHGETDWNKERKHQGRADIPLNKNGLAQAEKLAEIFRNKNIDLIISSPLKRTRQTAEVIAHKTGSEIIFDKDFQEQDLGEFEGKSYEEGAKHLASQKTDDKRYLGGESYVEVEKRFLEALLRHKKNHLHKNILIVTHGGTIMIFNQSVRNLPLGERPPAGSFGSVQVMELNISDPCKKCGGDMYEQDPDTLDTWFSSGLWPFSTLGWPEKTANLKTYFPNSVMETGYDILFFWVARMILMSTALTGEVPFRRVYLHGLVRDEKGRKMSKSLGNGIDPLEMADKYGADATRLSLIIGAAPGNDLKLSEDRIRGYRNFSTKIWNISRFVLMHKPISNFQFSIFNENHKKNIEEFSTLKKEVTAHIENFELHLAAEKLYHYVWHILADKIIEAEKKNFRDGTEAQKSESYALLEHLLLESLKMLHPFMPFVTEEIYRKFRPGEMLMVKEW